MRRTWLVWLLVALLIAPMSARMATGTVTVTSKTVFAQAGPVRQYRLAATSSSGGATSANPFTLSPGWLEAVKVVPSSGGTQPSDLFDCTLVDANGVDVLNGQGANLSNATGAYLQFSTPLFFTGSGDSQTLDLACTNAGNAKQWVAYVWIR